MVCRCVCGGLQGGAIAVMRVLSVNTSWPPFHVGGYEVGAWRLLRLMECRQNLHSYELVSKLGADQVDKNTEANIFRLLPLPGAILKNGRWISHQDKKQTQSDRYQATRIILDVVEQVKPALIVFWQYFGDGGYSVDILKQLAARQVPIFIYASNMQLPLHRLVPLRRILANASVPDLYSLARAARFKWQGFRYGWDGETASVNWSNVAFCSHYLKRRHLELGYPALPSKVIHWGIDRVYSRQAIDSHPRSTQALRLVWTGRICAPKGLRVLIEAMLSLPAGEFTLDIYGVIEDAGYWSKLVNLIEAGGRSSEIKYCGFLAPGDVRERLSAYDCFVLTSVWAEPFSVGLLEAMAEGLAIITTLTGGTPEIASEKNAVTYEAHSSAQLAARLKKLAGDPAGVKALQHAAIETAREFSLEKMADQMYASMCQAVQHA